MTFILFIILTFTSRPSYSNECGKTLSNFTSPVCTSAKYVFFSGLALTAGLRIFKSQFVDEVQVNATNKNHLKGWAQFGSDIGYGYLNGAYFLGQFLFGGKKGNQRAEHMIEASFYTLISTITLKKAIHETRPGFPEDPDSFPSGHSSFAFAFASVVSAQHGWIWGGLATTLATFIAFSRVNDDWHYLHDVIAGMTIGVSYGWGIYLNHKEFNHPYTIGVLPIDNMRGLALNYTLRY